MFDLADCPNTGGIEGFIRRTEDHEYSPFDGESGARARIQWHVGGKVNEGLQVTGSGNTIRWVFVNVQGLCKRIHPLHRNQRSQHQQTSQ